ncbi:hypothetical protein [Leifsonia sp. 22587]|uniref:hypothetical protein n=1 Tax=Leifsonia sp. 22587 TaxID=3453946 RepID=UPI003F83BA42
MAANATIGSVGVGKRLLVPDRRAAAQMIAIIFLGQASHAAEIIKATGVAVAPLPTVEALIDEAIAALTVTGSTKEQRDALTYHRDGLVFECIVWMAGWAESHPRRLSLSPHLSATTQGLDGLLIDWDAATSQIELVTIVEAKCSENPRDTFRDKVIPAFLDHEAGNRTRQVLATAAELLQQLGLDGTQATLAAQRVIGPDNRAYAASLAVEQSHDTDRRRTNLFKGYDAIKRVPAGRRIGEVLVVDDDLRKWFADVSALAIEYLEQMRSPVEGGVSSNV